MFAIGEFARHGRVSVRMLRHYDAIGLLQPVGVDPETGYRYYQAAQLSRLNQLAMAATVIHRGSMDEVLRPARRSRCGSTRTATARTTPVSCPG